MQQIKISVILMFMLSVLTACNKKVAFEFPFEKNNVTNIEIFRSDIHSNAEKKILTEKSDINGIYNLFVELTLQDKKQKMS